ncbi:hypothetical protein G9A89_020047 [Geosiphon pyriformis]|nr:hypothetical protein G9A89_020047 [Geosiphon pyriformis]
MESPSSTTATTTTTTDERIVLNVGGVKYETYRSTLTTYPTTLLGTMFQQRNKELLRPTNGNEYFFDRDGELFRFIMQFYRTGEFIWPNHGLRSEYGQQPLHPLKHQQQVLSQSALEISNYELKRELDFFQIPANYTQNFNHQQQQFPFAKAAALRVDELVAALKDALYEMIMNFRTKVGITFYWDKSIPVVNPKIDAVANIVIPFAFNGYHILHMFNSEIQEYLQLAFPDLVVSVDKFNGDTPRAHVNVYITLNNSLEPSIILENSCLMKMNLDGEDEK